MPALHRLRFRWRSNCLPAGWMNGALEPASIADSKLKWPALCRAAGQRPGLLISIVLAFITLAIYAPVISFDFVEFDDDSYVTGNLAVQNGLTFEGVLWAFRGFHVSNWHPLTMLSHMLDCSLFHLAAGGHHLTNLLFHTANTVLLFLLLRRMTGAVWRSAIVAALFAWHPLHVESVAWVAERKDVLSTLFLLLTVWAYVRYAEKPGLRRYSLVLLWFALGLMSKPMLVTLPGILLLLDYWPLGRMRFGAGAFPDTLKGGHQTGGGSARCPPFWESRGENARKLLLEKIPLVILSTAAGIATLWAQREWNALISLQSMPFSARLSNAVVSYAGYLGKMLWPVDLCAFYPLPGEISKGLLVCSALVLVGISLFVWRSRKNRQYLSAGWLWYLLTLLPVIGLVQVGGQAMADRYTYVPLLGIFIMMVWGIAPFFEAWSARQSVKTGLVSGLLLSCLLATGFQIQEWRNGVRLFVRCLEVTPNSFLVHHNLGVALSARGHKSEAIAQFRESLRLYTNNFKSHFTLAQELTESGETAEAIGHFAEAARLRPRDASVRVKLGVLLAQQGQIPEATDQFIAALKVEPENALAHLNLANALNQQGRTADAIGHYRVAIELDPAWTEALNRLACVLATHQDARFRDGVRAVRLAEKANDLTDHLQPALLNTLAAAYAEAGRFEEAVATEQRALQITLASAHQGLSPQIQNCLLLYQSGKPYRSGQ